MRSAGIACGRRRCIATSAMSACVRRAVDATIRELGRIDLLVNNAGLFETLPLESITLEQWDAMLNTNTRGPVPDGAGGACGAEAAAGAHREHRLAGRSASVGDAWALLRLQGRAAHADQDDGQGVGAGDQRELRGAGDDRERRGGSGIRALREKTPMRRNGTPEDVAAAVLFFATGPQFITGQVLSVDGGLGL